MKTTFTVKYSDKGTIYRPAEEQTYVYFVDFLDVCEGKSIFLSFLVSMLYFTEKSAPCSLEDVLIFASGADLVPLLGYTKPPTIVFVQARDRILPISSTRDVHLRLPTVHGSNYQKFQEIMVMAVLS